MTEEVYSDDFSEEENILQVVNKEQELVAKTNTNGLKGKTTTKKFASSHFHLPASTSVPSQPRISNIVEEKMLARRLAEEKRRLANAKATIECRASSSTPIGCDQQGRNTEKATTSGKYWTASYLISYLTPALRAIKRRAGALGVFVVSSIGNRGGKHFQLLDGY
eukprot:757994-Hanusia_phi.AAC.5